MLNTIETYGFEISPSGFIKVIIYMNIYNTSSNEIIASNIKNVLLNPNNYELANSILPEREMGIVCAVWQNL